MLVVDAGVPNENAGLVVVEVGEEDAGLSVVVAAAPKLNVGAAFVDDDVVVVVAVVIAGADFSEEVVVVVDVNAKGEGPCLGDVDPNENAGLSAAAGLSVVDFVVVVVAAGFSVVAAVLPKLKDGVLIIVLGDVVAEVVVLPIENGWAKLVSVAMVLSPVVVIGVAPAPNVNPPATLGDDGGCCADAPNVNVLAVGDVVLLVLDNEEPNAPNAGGVDGVVALAGAAGVKEGEPKGDVVDVVLVALAPKGDDVGEPNLKGCCAGDEGAAEVELVAGADVPKLGVAEVVVVVGAAAPKAGVGAAVFEPKEKDEGDEGCDPPLPN